MAFEESFEWKCLVLFLQVLILEVVNTMMLCNKFGNLESSFNLSLLGDVTVQF